jgi:hypothetical protein
VHTSGWRLVRGCIASPLYIHDYIFSPNPLIPWLGYLWKPGETYNGRSNTLTRIGLLDHHIRIEHMTHQETTVHLLTRVGSCNPTRLLLNGRTQLRFFFGSIYFITCRWWETLMPMIYTQPQFDAIVNNYYSPVCYLLIVAKLKVPLSR